MQIGSIVEDKESGLRLMIVRPIEDALVPHDLTFQGRPLTVSTLQPSGVPVEGIRLSMDPGSRSKPGPTPEI
jgi:hypothetical protein